MAETAGGVRPQSGKIAHGTNLQIAYSDQLRAQLDDKATLAVEEKAVEVGGKRLALEEQIGRAIARTYTDLMAAARHAHDAEMTAVTDRLTALEKRENKCQEDLAQVRKDNEELRKQNGSQQAALDSLMGRLRELEEHLKLSTEDRIALREALQQLRTQLQRTGAIAPGSKEHPALPAPPAQPLRVG